MLRPLTVCIAVCAFVAVPTAVAAAAFPGENGRIAYAKRWTRGDGYTFWSSRPDGMRQRRILRDATSLNFSADGRQVVFTRASGIGVARADGGDRSWLIGHAPREGNPSLGEAAFSPDGTQVGVTVHDVVPYGTNAYVIGLNDGNRRLIASDASGPVFSPDGTRIVYLKHFDVTGGETHQSAIETIAVDGTDRRRLHTYPPRNDYPEMTFPGRLDFAPDGRKFLVVELRNHVGRIVIRDAQTGDRIKRIPARVSGDVGNAVWSPDGRRIAFVVSSADPDELNKVFTIRPNGTGKRLAFAAISVWSDFSFIGGLAWQPRP